MLAIFLLILKIIGIVLLAVVGIVLLLILLILFVPVRYRVRAWADDTYDPKFKADAKVTWLLHLVNVLVCYPADELIRARICLFKVYPSGKDKKKDKKQKADNGSEIKADKKDNVSVNAEDQELSKNSDVHTTDACNDVKDAEKTTAENVYQKDPLPIEKEDKNRDNVKKSFKLIIKEKLEAFKKKISDIRAKISDVKTNTDKYIGIYHSETFQNAFVLSKRKLFGIIKSILPKRIKGYFRFGKEDSPDTVGMAYSAYSVLYPKIGKKFSFIPEFEKDVLNGNVYIKGRIYIFVLLFAAVRIYFDKNVKRMLKMLKKGEG